MAFLSISLTLLCFTYSFSRYLRNSSANLKRPPGGTWLWVGHQRELQLLPRIWALFPCHSHLCGQWYMEWWGAPVLAWVLYYSININQTVCFIPVGVCNRHFQKKQQKVHTLSYVCNLSTCCWRGSHDPTLIDWIITECEHIGLDIN